VADKTIVVHLPDYSGNTNLTLRLRADSTIINGAGDDLTETGSTGRFACVVTEAVSAGWHSVDIFDNGTLTLTRGWVYLPGDTEGTYTVDEPQHNIGKTGYELTAAYDAAKTAATQDSVDEISGFVLSPSPTVERVDGDEDAIRFSWPVNGATITGQVSKAGGAYGNVSGAISQRADDGGVYWYQLAYHANDRQLGSQRYKFTDGTYTRYVNLLVNPASADVDLTSVLDKLPTSGRAASQASVDAIDTNFISWVATGASAAITTYDPPTKAELDTAQSAIISACATATGFAVPGDAMALTPSERSTLAGVIDLAIINQGDGADLIGALADAIAADWVASDASPLAIIAALKADATYTTLIADAAAGKTAAELVRDRLTAARAEKLDRDLASVGSAMTLADDAITAAKFDESTAFPLRSADTGSTQVARTGADGDTLETLSDQIDLIDGGAGTGTGADTVTITVVDGDEDPIVSAKVRITLADETYLGVTNASGIVVFNVDGGGDDWTVAITKSGKSFAGAVLTISGDTEETYTMTNNSTPSPSDPALCVARTFFALNGEAIEGAVLCANLLSNSAVDATILSKSKTKATTDANGYAELELIREDQFTVGDGTYQITMTHNGIVHWSRQVKMPNQSSEWIEDIAEG